jgi:hypothetical protein
MRLLCIFRCVSTQAKSLNNSLGKVTNLLSLEMSADMLDLKQQSTVRSKQTKNLPLLWILGFRGLFFFSGDSSQARRHAELTGKYLLTFRRNVMPASSTDELRKQRQYLPSKHRLLFTSRYVILFQKIWISFHVLLAVDIRQEDAMLETFSC